jgi:hypothetical protein
MAEAGKTVLLSIGLFGACTFQTPQQINQLFANNKAYAKMCGEQCTGVRTGGKIVHHILLYVEIQRTRSGIDLCTKVLKHKSGCQ